MSARWNLERLAGAKVGERIGTYQVVCENEHQRRQLEAIGGLTFQALSVGDDHGQAFIVPLDESDLAAAEEILRAIRSMRATDGTA